MDGNVIDVSDRDYFKLAVQGQTNVSEPLISKNTGDVIVVFATPVKVDGKVVGVVGIVAPTSVITDVMAGSRNGTTGESYLVNADGYLFTPSRFTNQLKSSGAIQNRAEMELKINTFGSQQALSGTTGASQYQGYLGKEVLGAYTKIDGFNWGLISEVQTSEAFANLVPIRTAVIGISLLAMLIVSAVAYFLSRSITMPLGVVSAAALNLGVGDLDRDRDEETKRKLVSRKDETGDVARGLASTQAYMLEMAEVATRLADGDLTVNIQPKSDKDELGFAFSKMVDNLREVVSHISENATSLNAASDQLANAADQSGKAAGQIAETIQQVARGTAQQSDSISQTAISIEQMTRAIDGVAKGAQDQNLAVTRAAEITGQISNAILQVANNAKAGATGSLKAAEVAQGGSQIVEATIRGMDLIQTKVNLSAQKVQEMGRARIRSA